MSKYLRKLGYKKPSLEFNPIEEKDVMVNSPVTENDGDEYIVGPGDDWWN